MAAVGPRPLSAAAAVGPRPLSAAAAALYEAALRRHRPVPESRRVLNSDARWDAATRDDAVLGAVAPVVTRVYYLPHCFPAGFDLSRLLTDVPAIAVSGDRYIQLQDGSRQGGTGHQLPGLLTFNERRRARKRAIVSLERAYAHGGYGTREVEFSEPLWVGMATIAGPQFEVGYLEARDFIVAPESSRHAFPAGEVDAAAEPLFPHYYPAADALPHGAVGWAGRLPTVDEARAAVASGLADHPATQLIKVAGTGRYSDVDDAAYLYAPAYVASITEDMRLLLRGIDSWVGRLHDDATAAALGADAAAVVSALPSLAWVQLPGVGMGFFASYLMGANISSQLIPLFLQGLQRALDVELAAGRLIRIGALELCDFTRDGSFRLHTDRAGHIALVHGVRRGVLSLDHVDRTRFLPVVVNAGDSFALPGNEYGYTSVEAMLGENTSMRRSQVYLSNPALLEAGAWVPVDVRAGVHAAGT